MADEGGIPRAGKWKVLPWAARMERRASSRRPVLLRRYDESESRIWPALPPEQSGQITTAPESRHRLSSELGTRIGALHRGQLVTEPALQKP